MKKDKKDYLLVNGNGGQLSEEDVRRIIANPFYCVEIDASMSLSHPTMISEKMFIEAGVKIIAEDGDGGKKYLKSLLENLKGNFVR